MSYRDQGKTALGTVLNKEQNIRIIEKYVYNTSARVAEDDEEMEEMYKRHLYQTIGDILNGENLKDTLLKIQSGKLGWEHPAFKEMKNRMEEQDGFIENPFEVAEGVFECKAIDKNGKKCGSKRVLSYTKQCRSSDEPESIFATCCACGSKWTYNG
jgi:DNA-directed RNA polymerase subunit M/transcription elongation factor TFIIS